MDVQFFFELLRNVLPERFQKNQTSESHTDHDPQGRRRNQSCLQCFQRTHASIHPISEAADRATMSGEILRRRRLT